MNIDWFKKWFSPSELPNTVAASSHHDTDGILIPIDMMLKGNYFDRPRGKVRQCAVTIEGSTRLVTSGDKVDRETYKALLEVKAIKPLQTSSTPKGNAETGT